jgi:hypothetical protein
MADTRVRATGEQTEQRDLRGHEDVQAYFYDWFFGALARAMNGLAGPVPAWPEGTRVYYLKD